MTITSRPAPSAALGRPQLCIAHVSVGDEAPVFSVPLTLQRLVMEAGVNRDFTPLHHDDEDTRRTGAPRAYANTMFIEALIEAGIRTWIGDQGRLRKLTIQMIAFNLAGSLVSTGSIVTEIEPASPSENGVNGRVTMDIWVRSDGKLTVTGQAMISLPANCDGLAATATSTGQPDIGGNAES